MSSSITARSSSRQSKDNTKLPGGLDQNSVMLDSAEKNNRRKPLKFGSYNECGGYLSLSQDGYLSFSDSDGENNQNTPQKTTKKKRKKRGAGKGAKKSELFCFVLLYYDILLLLFTLKQYTNY